MLHISPRLLFSSSEPTEITLIVSKVEELRSTRQLKPFYGKKNKKMHKYVTLYLQINFLVDEKNTCISIVLTNSDHGLICGCAGFFSLFGWMAECFYRLKTPDDLHVHFYSTD